jgi:hypothetical protein
MSTTTQPTKEKLTKVTKPYHKGITIEDILEYKAKNLTHAEIGELLGCDASNVTKRLAPYRDDLNRLANHKKHDADILTLKGMRILDHITDEKLKEASAYQLTGMYGIIHQNERLKRDKSTQNIGVRTVVDNIEEELRNLD